MSEKKEITLKEAAELHAALLFEQNSSGEMKEILRRNRYFFFAFHLCCFRMELNASNEFLRKVISENIKSFIGVSDLIRDYDEKFYNIIEKKIPEIEVDMSDLSLPLQPLPVVVFSLNEVLLNHFSSLADNVFILF